MTIEEMKKDEDWEEVWNYAPKNVSMNDVERIIATDDGMNDGDDWIGIFKLMDGRYLHLWAGCDYTGWGCLEGGDSLLFDSEEKALSKLALGEDWRERLKDQLSEYKKDW